jgi:hypothetical protein
VPIKDFRNDLDELKAKMDKASNVLMFSREKRKKEYDYII